MGKGGKGKGWGQSWASPWQSWGKGGGGKGKGGGKHYSCPPERKVWIGGLPADATSRDLNKALLEHMKQAGECKFVEVGKTGNGSAAFTSAEEAANAIATLNGSTFQDSTLEVDTWTKKDGSAVEGKKCFAFEKGSCTRGDACRFSHA